METKDILKSLRKSKGYSTMQEFCSATGMNFSTYQNYESGKRMPTADVLLKLADFYNVTTDCLLGREPLPDPFADFHLTKEIEEDMLKKYLALPDGVRACVMDVIRQLGKTMPDDTQNGSEDVTDDYITITERAGDIVDRMKNAHEKGGVS